MNGTRCYKVQHLSVVVLSAARGAGNAKEIVSRRNASDAVRDVITGEMAYSLTLGAHTPLPTPHHLIIQVPRTQPPMFHHVSTPINSQCSKLLHSFYP